MAAGAILPRRCSMALSSRGPGWMVLSHQTGVRIPVAPPEKPTLGRRNLENTDKIKKAHRANLGRILWRTRKGSITGFLWTMNNELQTMNQFIQNEPNSIHEPRETRDEICKTKPIQPARDKRQKNEKRTQFPIPCEHKSLLARDLRKKGRCSKTLKSLIHSQNFHRPVGFRFSLPAWETR